MSNQAKEWDDMTETQQQQIKARLMAACDTEARPIALTPAVKQELMDRLAGGWRTDLGQRLDRAGH